MCILSPEKITLKINNCELSNVFLLVLIFLCDIVLLYVMSNHVRTNALVFIIPALICLSIVLIPCKKKECKHDKFVYVGFNSVLPYSRIYIFTIKCVKCKKLFSVETNNHKKTIRIYEIDPEVLDL